MSSVLDIENIKMVSVNQKYTKDFRLTESYRAFKAIITANCKRGMNITPPYRVDIFLAMYLDIDNPIKCILDGMAGAGVIDNDKNIIELNIKKESIKRGKPGRVKIEVFGGHKL